MKILKCFLKFILAILNFFRKLVFNRIVWISLMLLFELTFLGCFCYIIVTNLHTIFNLSLNSSIIILVVFLYAITIISSIYLVNTNQQINYKVTWFFFISVIPVIGILLFLIFGNKKYTSRQAKKVEPIYYSLKSNSINYEVINQLKNEDINAYRISNYISESSGCDVYTNTNVKYYKSGEDAFPVMVEELKKAKSFIFIEYFILGVGTFWNTLLDVLKEKVKEGVDVRLMYDDVGCAKSLPYGYDKYLRKLGLKVIVYNKFKPFLDVKLNNRDHRKIMVIDGKVAFSGGINLADEYINTIELFGYWKDNAIKIEGDAVSGYTSLFLSQWLYRMNEIQNIDFKNESFAKYFPKCTDVKPDGYVQPYGDIPFDFEPVGQRGYMNLISRAKNFIYITTPYLIIDDEFKNALVIAALQGVDVRIITPHIPDKKLTFNITRSYYRDLLRAGVKIYEFTPGFIHMKMFIVDDIYATVGTINLDYRSFYLHLENTTLFINNSAIKDMKKDYLDTINQSQLVTYSDYKKHSAIKRFLWGVLRVFSPLF